MVLRPLLAALAIVVSVVGGGPPAAAQTEALRAAALAKTPWARLAGVWVGEATGAARNYTMRLLVRTGSPVLDGNDSRYVRCQILSPPGLEKAACLSFSLDPFEPAPGGFRARMVGEYNDTLAGLFAPASGMSVLSVTVPNDDLTLTGKFGESDVRFRRVVPIVERVEIPEITQSQLTLERLRTQWKLHRDNRGSWGYYAPSPPLVLRISGQDLPPQGFGPGLVTTDDPHLELVRASTLPQGTLELGFMLHEGVQPGRKRVTLAGGASFEIDLRILGMEGNPPPPRPAILDVVALDDQSRLRYDIPQYRRLFVAGIGLPQTFAGASVAALGGEPTVTYSIVAAVGETAPRTGDAAKGWQLTGFSPGNGVSGLIVDARLNAGVRPGLTGITIDGAEGTWLLAFADNRGQIEFVRQVRDGEFETTDALLGGEPFALDVWVEAPLPGNEIVLEVAAIDRLDVATGAPLRVAARKVGQAGRRTHYRSAVLALDLGPNAVPPPKGATAIKGDAGGKVFARGADPDLVRFEPATVSALTFVKPADIGATWDDAVAQAGACVSLDLAGAKAQLGRQVADAERFIVAFNFRAIGRERLKIGLGEHAAALLLRHAFRERLTAIRQTYTEIAANPTAIRGFRLMMARQANNQRQPLNGVAVHNVDGGEMRFDSIHDVRASARLPADKLAAWQDSATREALGILVASMDKALESAAGPVCEAERWIMLSSLGFDDIVQAVAPTLMKERIEADGSRLWEPDLVARSYLKAVAQLGDEIRGLADYQRVARNLTGVVLLPAFFAGGALLASASLLEFVIGLGLAVADAAIPAADLADYFDDQAEIAFAAGAAPAIGLDRLDAVGSSASGPVAAAATALGVVVPGLGALSGTASRLARIAAARKLSEAAERGAALARSRPFTREAVAAMSEAERADAAAFVALLNAREAAGGARAISSSERAFLDSIKTLSDGPPIFPVSSGAAPARLGAGDILTGGRISHQGQELTLGGRLGTGGANHVYAVAGRNDIVVRVRRGADAADEAFESFGRSALSGENPAVASGQLGRVDPNIVRIVGRETIGTGRSGVLNGRVYEIVERMPEGSAAAQLGARPMSPGQANAVNRALRELNGAGLAWTDAHTGNFSFVRGKGPDEWSVVVIDPGGIVPARGASLAERAGNARVIQQAVASPQPLHALAYDLAARRSYIPSDVARNTMNRIGDADRTRIEAVAQPLIDYGLFHPQAAGLPVNQRPVFMRPLPMLEQEAARNLLNADNPEAVLAELRAAAAAQPRRRAGRPPPRGRGYRPRPAGSPPRGVRRRSRLAA